MYITCFTRCKIIETFIKVDGFCKEFSDDFSKFKRTKIGTGIQTRNRAASLSDSEVITILISLHGGQFRNFKSFYLHYVYTHLKSDFPGVVSYNRFIELSHRCALAFMLFIHHCAMGKCTGISFIDSTILRVCYNKRIKRNKMFKGFAEVGKSTIGWFYGFKLHLIINDKCEILSFYLTKENVDDRDIKTLTKMTED